MSYNTVTTVCCYWGEVNHISSQNETISFLDVHCCPTPCISKSSKQIFQIRHDSSLNNNWSYMRRTPLQDVKMECSTPQKDCREQEYFRNTSHISPNSWPWQSHIGQGRLYTNMEFSHTDLGIQWAHCVHEGLTPKLRILTPNTAIIVHNKRNMNSSLPGEKSYLTWDGRLIFYLYNLINGYSHPDNITNTKLYFMSYLNNLSSSVSNPTRLNSRIVSSLN